jgi:TonB family protein
MTRESFPTRSVRAFLAYCFGRSRAATPAQVARSEARALHRLRQEPMWTSDAPLLEMPPFNATSVRARTFSTAAVCAIAAATCLFVIVSGLVLRSVVARRSLVAVVEAGESALSLSSDGHTRSLHSNERIKFGEIVRSDAGSGGMLRLADGSHVEVRSHSELYLEHADDGVRIRLNQGGIIVNAAKQHEGHLYVQTKDFVVSVVGTVFLVNAEDVGSRVAVLEGEVRVRQDGRDQKLLPGQQVTTGAVPSPSTVPEEIAWSRNAPSHLALLEQSAQMRQGQLSSAAQAPPTVQEPQPSAVVRSASATQQSRFVRLDLVSVDVAVHDASGQPVSGLRQADFKVLEDGIEQRIESLSFEKITSPVASSSSLAIAGDAYYLLGYRFTPGGRPGRFRKIAVAVNRPDVRVESRMGYYPEDAFARGAYPEDEPDLVAPVPQDRPEPSYPPIAVSARVQGSVVVEAVVDVDGRVSRSRVVPSPGKALLELPALDSINQWTFTPGELRGQKVPVLMQFVVTFRLH